jgi:hypothetical protein
MEEETMRKHRRLLIAALVLAGSLASHPVAAQLPSQASDRIRAALPADAADRVLATIAEAHTRKLPATTLENRTMELAAKGVNPQDIVSDVIRHAHALDKAQAALARGGRTSPSAEEIEAAAHAMSKGVNGRAVSDLAKIAPADRTIAVPIYVLSNLTQNGEGLQEALAKVSAALTAGTSDEQMQRGLVRRPAEPGQGLRPVTPPVSTPGAGGISVPAARGADAPEPPSGTPGRRP